MVPGCHVVHIGAHRLDDAGAFVAQHARCAGRQCAGGLGQVGVAHTAGGDAHPDLVGRKGREGDVLDLQWLSHGAENGAAFTHPGYLCSA